MSQTPVVLHGITQEDIQRMLQQTVKKFGKSKFSVLGFDANYCYNFHKEDFFPYIQKLNLIPRYDHKQSIEWHRLLERWYADQTVRDSFGREIKPKQIVRQMDQVVVQGLEQMAKAILGQVGKSFKFGAIGEGVIEPEDINPQDVQLEAEVLRIDVTQSNLGGSLSREGTTVYVNANFPITLESTNISETGVFDSMDKSNDNMLDHTAFDVPINHDKNEDVQGFTTVIYVCGA